jgi:YbbR domain-containing protein
MMRAIKFVLSLIFRNFWWKLLALAVAVAFWALVASEPELETFARVPLEFRNLPDDLEISSNVVDTVNVEVRGPARELGSLASGNRPAVVLDMADVTPGQHTFPITGPAVVLPRGMRLVRAMPGQVRMDFERRGSRDVPVRVRFTGTPAGYQVADFSVAPKQVRLTGPESRVGRVSEAVTDPVDLSPVVGTAEFHVNTFVEDAFVRFQSSPQVVVTVTMKKN